MDTNCQYWKTTLKFCRAMYYVCIAISSTMFSIILWCALFGKLQWVIGISASTVYCVYGTFKVSKKVDFCKMQLEECD